MDYNIMMVLYLIAAYTAKTPWVSAVWYMLAIGAAVMNIITIAAKLM